MKLRKKTIITIIGGGLLALGAAATGVSLITTSCGSSSSKPSENPSPAPAPGPQDNDNKPTPNPEVKPDQDNNQQPTPPAPEPVEPQPQLPADVLTKINNQGLEDLIIKLVGPKTNNTAITAKEALDKIDFADSVKKNISQVFNEPSNELASSLTNEMIQITNPTNTSLRIVFENIPLKTNQDTTKTGTLTFSMSGFSKTTIKLKKKDT